MLQGEILCMFVERCF